MSLDQSVIKSVKLQTVVDTLLVNVVSCFAHLQRDGIYYNNFDVENNDEVMLLMCVPVPFYNGRIVIIIIVRFFPLFNREKVE